jgi:hypothetical protein
MVCRGIIMDIIPIKDVALQVVIKVKKDDIYLPVAFTAFSSKMVLIKQVNMEKGDAVKIDYYLKSKKFENQYSTSAIIEKICLMAKKSPQLMIDMETGEILR